MEESDEYIEETIGLLPRPRCFRQERILLNAFFIRSRLKTMSNYGLICMAFSRPNQHLLSFYELFDRLLSQRIGLKDLLILMQALRDARETRKIDAMYFCSLGELERQIKTEDPLMIAEALAAYLKAHCLSARIFLEIETILVVRLDGLEAGLKIAETVPEIDMDRIRRAYEQMHGSGS
ncbi:MAG TPA: hypothetical protein P5080_05535 [Candidatus Paceibacterota bacterium]|nr:hypothetical protein [Candidatus Pacearchaeota archaeon]HRZ51408.1 hypothetical protein [Candidatus Paceibacterota bacterium]HSA37130.1 hypothetical protein [Candidatus Paceibacterota bacterium]